jgi:hypothetical protein
MANIREHARCAGWLVEKKINYSITNKLPHTFQEISFN